MAHEILVGLMVTDDALYGEYRAAMLPLLERAGGRFRYDFKVAETLRAEGGASINRVFTICFPSLAAREAFFADEAYRAVRARFFEPAVAASALLAAYELEA